MDSTLIVKRLSYIKYLFLQGVSQAERGDVLAGYSILSFHDAVDMFMALVYEHKNPNQQTKNRKLFLMNYFDEVPELTHKVSIKKLNDCRNSIKHNAQFPSKDDIEKIKVTTLDFFVENSQSLLNVDFETVSLIDLVTYPNTRSYLQAAQRYYHEEKYYKGAVECSKAFKTLLSEHESSKHLRYHNLLKIGDNTRKIDRTLFLSGKKGVFDHRHQRWFDDVNSNLHDLRDALSIIAIGIDYRHYRLFKAITPEVRAWPECKWDVFIDEESFTKRVQANKRVADTTINFIIECAVKLQETDFDLSKFLKSSELETTIDYSKYNI